jgi:YidC/Oxa1 family membrane protein insertase
MFGTPIIGLANNPVFHAVGEIFQPILRLVGYALALIYGLIPNYAIAIAILTIVIMVLLTPLTIKSTKSMMAMQRMQPEMKKLQAKYKGPENRQKLNEELMKLYKEHGINPLGGCLPTFLQMPFLYILYDVIRGLTATTKVGSKLTITPRYIPKPTNLHAANVPLIDRMYHNLLASGGQLKAFGMDLTLKPFSHHSSTAAAIPFFVFVVVAVGLQYFQMSQMTRRNPAAAQANRQAQNIQKLLPIFFGYIYFLIPSAVVIYMIVSTIIRIATQDILFRTGIVQIATPNAERTISGAKSRELSKGPASLPPGSSTQKSTPKAEGPSTRPAKSSSNGSSNGNGSRTNGNGSGAKPSATGSAASRSRQANEKPEANAEEDAASKAHPRAKNKRDRRIR